jgi:hypothetical protein
MPAHSVGAVAVSIVDLQSDDGVAAGRGQLAAVAGAERHFFAVEQERDRLRGGHGASVKIAR